MHLGIPEFTTIEGLVKNLDAIVDAVKRGLIRLDKCNEGFGCGQVGRWAGMHVF